MIKFFITEKQNFNSHRQGVQIEAKNLTAAKRKATKMQMFMGTIMEIETLDGETLAVKEKNGKWIDQGYFNS